MGVKCKEENMGGKYKQGENEVKIVGRECEGETLLGRTWERR